MFYSLKTILFAMQSLIFTDPIKSFGLMNLAN